MSIQLSKHFESAAVEQKWYAYWESKGYFASTPDERDPYTILIPPPNVTGVLHMGHMLNNTIQDVLIRRARLNGLNACWVPGTDHASIATEAKVVKMLREKGIKKSDLTRDEFLEHAWGWKEEYGGKILKQLRKLGASCDWDRTAFTMDEVRSEHVYKAFVDLYEKGKLYRGLRMVNWDPEAQTVLSNEEVIHNEENGKLYHMKYMIVGEVGKYVTIATTRPETLLGDTAIAVHPDDPRYTDLKGKSVTVPLINRDVKIIFDDYVDIEFGTGALKVTPAHDVNDYELGKKHNLGVVDIFEDNGSISEAGLLYIGMDRFDVRKQIVKDLKNADLIVEIEDYRHSVGRSERTNAVVEPKLSLQWYVDMPAIAKPALEAVESDEVEFFPKNMKNTYRHWMSNIKDWCISRQLWWGHRIPAYYYGDYVAVALDAETALKSIQEQAKDPSITMSEIKQDEDVLDTWFSSWLWPMSTFNGWFDQKELDYYYPTSVLVTGWDIIFLWVARMVMAGYEWQGTFPFKDVYFTGMVRDKKRRKMSKSLGNSPDALKLIEEFGADGVRFGMLSCSPAGGDLLFDDKLCLQGRNFSNKIWNALKLIHSWDIDESLSQPTENTLASEWINHKFNEVSKLTEQSIADYRLSEALIKLYSYIWDDYCSWYLEMIKPAYQSPIDSASVNQAKAALKNICILLHPFMPFITEEVWSTLKTDDDSDCIVTRYPEYIEVDESLVSDFERLKEVVSSIRDTKNQNQINLKELLPLSVVQDDESTQLLSRAGIKETMLKIGYLESINVIADGEGSGYGFIVGKSKYYLESNQEIDAEAELQKLLEELKYQEGFLISVTKKLDNKGFVANAPAKVVEMEQKKKDDSIARIALIKEAIDRLKKS